MPHRRWYALVLWLIAMLAWVPQALARSRHFVVDLTHPIPTFQPLALSYIARFHHVSLASWDGLA